VSCMFVLNILKSIVTMYNNMNKIMSSDIKLWQLCINAEAKFIILRQMWVFVIRIIVPVLELGSIYCLLPVQYDAGIACIC
jgi:hypothetical protein